jgi:molecular chaperone GrpE
MLDQQALFNQFLNLLQTPPPFPEYLEEEPESATPFDPYQMVAEWIALRHEVKQQGKLLQTSQNSLHQALEGLQAEKEHLQQQLAASQKGATQTDQQSLWRELLMVLDSLDQADHHWQEQLETLSQPPSRNRPKSLWRRWLNRWGRWLQQLAQPTPDEKALNESASVSTSSLREILVSNQEGIALIRRSLLDVLRQRQVTPIPALGQPFNPQIMYAIGRQEDTSVPENTVIQEVVKGYFWGDQVLREAQVIVAGRWG